MFQIWYLKIKILWIKFCFGIWNKQYIYSILKMLKTKYDNIMKNSKK